MKTLQTRWICRSFFYYIMETKNELIVNPKEFGLEENKAIELTSGLTTILTERETLKNAYLDVIELDVTENNIKVFKELRLKIVKNRTQGIEKWHKTTKDFFLTGGRFVDSVKNKEIFENERMENALLEKEKYFENLEKERLLALKLERESIISPFGYDFSNVDLSQMDSNMFEMILTGAKKTHEDKIIAEQKAEAERLEAERLEKERLEAQRIENERLKKEAEIKEAQLKKEREEAEKREAELKAKAEAEAKKQAEILAKQKAEADAVLKKEQEAKAKIEAELKAKKEAEIKAENERLAKEKDEKEAAKKASLAPDKDKLINWINSISLTKIDLKSTESKAIKDVIEQKFEAFKKWSVEQVESIK